VTRQNSKSSQAERVRLVLLGVGGFGRQWVKAVGSCRQVQPVALVDPDARARARAGEALGVHPDRRVASLDELDSVEFDAAVVCTPPSTRPEIYRRLAESGKGIVTEKPLAANMTEAREAAAIQRRTGVPFVVAQNYRYRPVVQEARRVLASGKLGQPGVCQLDFHRHPLLSGFRKEMPYPLLIDMSIHHFDLARFLLAAEPISVIGRSWNSPWSSLAGEACAAVSFRMSDDVQFVYNGSWSSVRPKRYRTTWTGNWSIECEQGWLWIKDDKLWIAPWWRNKKGAPSWGRVESLPLPEARSEQLQVLEQFLIELDGGPPAPTGVHDNILSLTMVFAAIDAAEQHREVDVRSMLR